MLDFTDDPYSIISHKNGFFLDFEIGLIPITHFKNPLMYVMEMFSSLLNKARLLFCNAHVV